MKDMKIECQKVANKLRSEHLKQKARAGKLTDAEKLELKLLLEGHNFSANT